MLPVLPLGGYVDDPDRRDVGATPDEQPEAGPAAPVCSRCGVAADAAPDGVPEGWSLATSPRGVDRLCAACTRENVRAIEARLDEEWW